MVGRTYLGLSASLMSMVGAGTVRRGHGQEPAVAVFPSPPDAAVVCPAPSPHCLRTYISNVHGASTFRKRDVKTCDASFCCLLNACNLLPWFATVHPARGSFQDGRSISVDGMSQELEQKPS